MYIPLTHAQLANEIYNDEYGNIPELAVAEAIAELIMDEEHCYGEVPLDLAAIRDVYMWGYSLEEIADLGYDIEEMEDSIFEFENRDGETFYILADGSVV